MADPAYDRYLQEWLAAASTPDEFAALRKAYAELTDYATREARRIAASYERRMAEMLMAGMTRQEAAGLLLSQGWEAERMERLRVELNRRLARYTTQHAALFDNAVSEGIREALASTASQLDIALQGKDAYGLMGGGTERGMKVTDNGAFAGWEIHNERAFAAAVAATQPGTTLTSLLERAYGDYAGMFAQRLRESIATGEGPFQTARRISRDMEVPFTRAATIVRTETLRSMRVAQLASITDAASLYGVDVIGYRWKCALDKNTCLACWSRHGQITFFGNATLEQIDRHTIGHKGLPHVELSAPPGVHDMVQDHPNGRCRVVPVFAWDAAQSSYQRDMAWQDLGEEGQIGVMGPSRWQAWRDDKAKWTDFATTSHSPDWGDHIRVKSLRELNIERVPTGWTPPSRAMTSKLRELSEQQRAQQFAGAMMSTVEPLPGLPRLFTMAENSKTALIHQETLDTLAEQANLMWERYPELRFYNAGRWNGRLEFGVEESATTLAHAAWTGEIAIYPSVQRWATGLRRLRRELEVLEASGDAEAAAKTARLIAKYEADIQEVMRHELLHALQPTHNRYIYGEGRGVEEGLVEYFSQSTALELPFSGASVGIRPLATYPEYVDFWRSAIRGIEALRGDAPRTAVRTLATRYWQLPMEERLPALFGDLFDAYVEAGYTRQQAADLAFFHLRTTAGTSSGAGLLDISGPKLDNIFKFSVKRVEQRYGVRLTPDVVRLAEKPGVLRTTSTSDDLWFTLQEHSPKRIASLWENGVSVSPDTLSTALPRLYPAASEETVGALLRVIENPLLGAEVRNDLMRVASEVVRSHPESLELIGRYTGPDLFRPLSQYLRAGGDITKVDLSLFRGGWAEAMGFDGAQASAKALLDDFAERLSALIKDAAGRYAFEGEITAYRGVYGAFADGLSLGDTFTDGFVSTSAAYDQGVAFALTRAGDEGALMVLRVKTKDYLLLGDLSVFPEQAELLLNKGLTYTVKEIRYVNGRKVVFVDVV